MLIYSPNGTGRLVGPAPNPLFLQAQQTDWRLVREANPSQRCRIKSGCAFPRPLRSRRKSARPSLASNSLSDRMWSGSGTKSVKTGAASGPSSSGLYLRTTPPGAASARLRQRWFGDWHKSWISLVWEWCRTTISEVCLSRRCCRNQRGLSGRPLGRRAFSSREGGHSSAIFS